MESTLKILDFVYEYTKNYGVNIYAWDKVCWKCGKNTKVYSYYLSYDLSEVDNYFESFSNVGLGDINSMDKLLSTKYPNIYTCKKLLFNIKAYHFFTVFCIGPKLIIIS
jgi:hypothetical protein